MKTFGYVLIVLAAAILLYFVGKVVFKELKTKFTDVKKKMTKKPTTTVKAVVKEFEKFIGIKFIFSTKKGEEIVSYKLGKDTKKLIILKGKDVAASKGIKVIKTDSDIYFALSSINELYKFDVENAKIIDFFKKEEEVDEDDDWDEDVD